MVSTKTKDITCKDDNILLALVATLLDHFRTDSAIVELLGLPGLLLPVFVLLGLLPPVFAPLGPLELFGTLFLGFSPPQPISCWLGLPFRIPFVTFGYV